MNSELDNLMTDPSHPVKKENDNFYSDDSSTSSYDVQTNQNAGPAIQARPELGTNEGYKELTIDITKPTVSDEVLAKMEQPCEANNYWSEVF